MDDPECSIGAEGETRTRTSNLLTSPSSWRVYQFHHFGKGLYLYTEPYLQLSIINCYFCAGDGVDTGTSTELGIIVFAPGEL